MAKKIFLKEEEEIVLPITRGELVLDSSGNPALHSKQFLATDTMPGLMSPEDKIALSEGTGNATVTTFYKTDLSVPDEAFFGGLESFDFKKGDIFVIHTVIDNAEYETTGYIVTKDLETQDFPGLWMALTHMNGYVDADKVIFKKDIVMAGSYTQVGNLSKTSSGVKTFATKGRSVEDAFMEIFSKDSYPSTTSTNGSLSVGLSSPYISANIANNSTVKVGTTVKFNPIAANKVSATMSNSQVSGFTYGYKDTLEGSINTATSITKSGSASVNSGTYTLTATATGFSGTLSSSSSTSSSHSSCKLENNTLKVSAGSNKFSVTETGPGGKGTSGSIESKFIVSALGNTDTSHKSKAVVGTDQSKSSTSSSNSYSITGVYPIYYNVSGSTNIKDPTVELVSSISYKELTFGPSTSYRNTLCYPKHIGNASNGYKCAVQIYNNLSKSYEEYKANVTWTEITKTINGTDYTYIQWTDSVAYTESVQFKFTFSKSTSSKN